MQNTHDMEKRVTRHEIAKFPDCYTASRLPVTLVFSQEFASREEALAAERQIKGWSRKKKEALIRGDWKEIQRIAWGKNNPLPDHLK